MTKERYKAIQKKKKTNKIKCGRKVTTSSMNLTSGSMLDELTKKGRHKLTHLLLIFKKNLELMISQGVVTLSKVKLDDSCVSNVKRHFSCFI